MKKSFEPPSFSRIEFEHEIDGADSFSVCTDWF